MKYIYFFVLCVFSSTMYASDVFKILSIKKNCHGTRACQFIQGNVTVTELDKNLKEDKIILYAKTSNATVKIHEWGSVKSNHNVCVSNNGDEGFLSGFAIELSTAQSYAEATESFYIAAHQKVCFENTGLVLTTPNTLYLGDYIIKATSEAQDRNSFLVSVHDRKKLTVIE